MIPPRIAPLQVIIVPIPNPSPELFEAASKIMAALKSKGISVKYENDETKRPGFKFAEYEMRGIPVRLGLGKRDLENGTVEVARRDTREKTSVPLEGIENYVADLLERIQDNLFQKAKAKRDELTTSVDNWADFERVLNEKGGFLFAHWDGTAETEDKIKELTKATIRCIPLDSKLENGACILTGKPSAQRVLFARAY